MANKARYFKNSPLPLVQQKAALCSVYKDSNCIIRKNELLWCGKVKPTALSDEYTIILKYSPGESPKVWVTGKAKALERLDDPDFPHIFEIDDKNKMVRICLYRYSEFNSSKLLANTIIPWAIEWLYFYELWLTTGEWLGGGEHPDPGKAKVED